MTYRIKDWDRHFEVAQSRLIKGRMTWVAMPTKHDGLGYKRVMRAGPLHYAAWVLLVEVAAKCPTRGLLVNSDRALTPEDLEVMTEFPAKHFAAAFPVLVDVGWLEPIAGTDDTKTLVEHSENATSAVGACSVYKTGQYSTEQDSTQQDSTNRTKQKERELPFETQAFTEAWRAWEAHRRDSKHPLTNSTKALQLKKLAKMGEARAIACLEHSTTNGWQGLFEPKAGDQGGVDPRCETDAHGQPTKAALDLIMGDAPA